MIIDHSVLCLHQASLTFLSLPQTPQDMWSVRSWCFGIITFVFAGVVLLIKTRSLHSKAILNELICAAAVCFPSARACIAVMLSQPGKVQPHPPHLCLKGRITWGWHDAVFLDPVFYKNCLHSSFDSQNSHHSWMSVCLVIGVVFFFFLLFFCILDW